MALIDYVDLFVFYDCVQFEHQSWQTRNKIKVAHDTVQWLSVPAERNFKQKLNEVKISGRLWRGKHWKTIEQNYSKCPHFKPYCYYIEDLFETPWLQLSEMNIYNTKMLAEYMDLKKPKFAKSSDYHLGGSKTDRLMMLLEKVGATEYVSGLGAKNYLDESRFSDIKLTWFDYKHPTYPQRGKQFIPYLSVIDLLFNVGENAVEHIRAGIIPSR